MILEFEILKVQVNILLTGGGWEGRGRERDGGQTDGGGGLEGQTADYLGLPVLTLVPQMEVEIWFSCVGTRE